jgi:hypothetical protein
MTAEESAMRQFQDEPFFEIMVKSIARSAADYAYSKTKYDMTLGAGTSVDCIIREHVLKRIEILKRIDES